MSMSTVVFSRDGTRLLADVKGLTDEKVPGFIAMWSVNEDGSLSEDHELYPAPSKIGALNFGMSYLPEGHEGYILADPSVGGIVLGTGTDRPGCDPPTFLRDHTRLLPFVRRRVRSGQV
jgi:hypothetical protein